MRPHKLTLKAFGPFAKETTIDFDAMGNNIYLISGNTGAGKTTIFDGIIYALYGTASGGARSGLGTEAFHSDYAKDGAHREELRVELVFSNAGRMFTVERRMNWGKKGSSGTVNKESTLSENGNTLVCGKGREDRDDVTQKVTELLGLDADQFRRIIMLAQGEFQKFLTAKNDERGEILGKLYDNRLHRDFQMRLKAAAALLRDQMSDLIRDEEAQLKIFVLPEDINEEQKSALTVDHPELLTAIQSIINGMEITLNQLQTSVNKKEESLDQLKDRKSKAENSNRLLESLETKKAQFAEADKQIEVMDKLRVSVTLAQAAERVLPAEKAMRNAESEWQRINEQIQTLEEEKKQLEGRSESLKNTAEESEKKNKPSIEKLNEKLSSIKSILPLYDDLEGCRKNYNEIENKKKNTEEAVVKQKTAVEKLQEQQRTLSETLTKLADAGESAVSLAERRKNDLTDRKNKLTALQTGIGTVKTLCAEEEPCIKTLQSARNAELAAEAEHLRLNTAFIQGQAGVLAQDMLKKLESAETVLCPVCGTSHTAADVKSFAVLHDDVPLKDAVDQAYTAWNAARQMTQKADNAYNAKKTERVQKKKSVLDQAQELLGGSEWDCLVNSDVLSDALTDCTEQYAAAVSAYNQAVADKKEKEKTAEHKIAVDKEIQTAEEKLSETLNQLNDIGKKAAAAQASLQSVEQKLKEYPGSKEDAEKQINSLKNETGVLQKEIDDAKEAIDQCSQKQAKNNGSLENAYAEKEKRTSEKDIAEAAFAESLQRNAFADEAAFSLALSPEGESLDEKALAAWISEKKDAIDAYDERRHDLGTEIRQLTDSTKGMQRVDTQSLSDKIDEEDKLLKTARKEAENLSSALQRNRTVYEELASIREKREKNQVISNELMPLSDVANGKYAFSRYVLKGFFERIVEQANQHLDIMTDGEYCLVPKEDGDGRSNIGLGLKVLNTITNLERETATLSGGQLFEASLSLALGLSDVVQMESASTVQIDSMFIDEGFGSLDGSRLDKALEVLNHLSGGKRQIGIISHVARLDESLPRKIHVLAGNTGSTVRIETDV